MLSFLMKSRVIPTHTNIQNYLMKRTELKNLSHNKKQVCINLKKLPDILRIRSRSILVVFSVIKRLINNYL